LLYNTKSPSIEGALVFGAKVFEDKIPLLTKQPLRLKGGSAIFGGMFSGGQRNPPDSTTVEKKSSGRVFAPMTKEELEVCDSTSLKILSLLEKLNFRQKVVILKQVGGYNNIQVSVEKKKGSNEKVRTIVPKSPYRSDPELISLQKERLVLVEAIKLDRNEEAIASLRKLEARIRARKVVLSPKPTTVSKENGVGDCQAEAPVAAAKATASS